VRREGAARLGRRQGQADSEPGGARRGDVHGRARAAYAPAGVGEDAVRTHLERLHANVELVASEARTEELTTESAL
jgi:hypothetical protein